MARIAILLDDDFEDSEFATPRTTLLEREHEVDVIATETDRELRGKRGAVVTADRAIADADAATYDALVIPGGYSPDRLRINDGMVRFTRSLGDRGVPIAAICHAGWMLIEAGLAEGRTVTSWPSLRTDLVNAGATWVDEEVVVDGNLITSRRPDDLPVFVRTLLEALGDDDHLRHEGADRAERTASGPDEPVVATGADTLIEVLQRAAEDGYRTQLVARASGEIECGNCERTIPPAALEVDREQRLEGASDAAEMMLVVWCRCPACRTRGTLTLGYGPNAAEADVAVTPKLARGPAAT